MSAAAVAEAKRERLHAEIAEQEAAREAERHRDGNISKLYKELAQVEKDEATRQSVARQNLTAAIEAYNVADTEASAAADKFTAKREAARAARTKLNDAARRARSVGVEDVEVPLRREIRFKPASTAGLIESRRARDVGGLGW